MSLSLGGVGRSEIKRPEALFKSSWDKWNLAQKIGAGVLFALLVPLAIFWKCGGFQKTLHVYDPCRNGPIDTNLRQSDLRKLTATGSLDSLMQPAAKRAMAVEVLKTTQAKNLEFLTKLPVDILTNAVDGLVKGDDTVLEKLTVAHENFVKAKIIPIPVRGMKELAEDFEKKVPDLKQVEHFPPERSVGKIVATISEAMARVRPLLADIVCPVIPAGRDQTEGDRIHALISANIEMLEWIIYCPKLLNIQGILQDTADALKKVIEAATEQFVKSDQDWGEYPQSDKEKSMALTLAIRDKISPEDFQKIAEDIDEVLKKDSGQAVPPYMLAQLNLAPEMKEVGTFLGEAVKNYFEAQTAPDRRAMIASQFREPKSDGTQMSYFAGLLKGAGPYLQTLLRSFGDNATGPLKTALAELKTGLTPIPNEIKRAMLADFVKNSDVRITKIDDLRSLSVTPVGETISAKISFYDSGKQETSQDVVIKLLRPGIQERAAREITLLQTLAAKIPGMADQLKTITDRIDTKMDLRLQAANVRRAQDFGTGAANVTTMKLAKGFEPTQSVLVLEKAPGATLDTWVQFFRDHAQNPLASVPSPDGARTVIPFKVGNKLTSALGSTQMWMEKALDGSGFHHGDLDSRNIMFSTNGGEGLLTVIDLAHAAAMTTDHRQAIIGMYSACESYSDENFIDEVEKCYTEDGQKALQRSRDKVFLQGRVKAIMMARTVPMADVILATQLFETQQIERPEYERRCDQQYALPERRDAQKWMSPAHRVEKGLEVAKAFGVKIPTAIANFSRSHMRSHMMLQNVVEEVNAIRNEMTAVSYGQVLKAVAQEIHAEARTILQHLGGELNKQVLRACFEESDLEFCRQLGRIASTQLDNLPAYKPKVNIKKLSEELKMLWKQRSSSMIDNDDPTAMTVNESKELSRKRFSSVIDNCDTTEYHLAEVTEAVNVSDALNPESDQDLTRVWSSIRIQCAVIIAETG